MFHSAHRWVYLYAVWTLFSWPAHFLVVDVVAILSVWCKRYPSWVTKFSRTQKDERGDLLPPLKLLWYKTKCFIGIWSVVVTNSSDLSASQGNRAFEFKVLPRQRIRNPLRTRTCTSSTDIPCTAP